MDNNVAPPRGTFARWTQALERWLFDPEDAASLVVFRIAFGLVMAWDMLGYATAGWTREYFYTDLFLFKYHPFEWVDRLPPAMLRGVLYGSVVAALGVAFGAFYRVCAIALFLGHTYVFLLSASHYLNHAYLISLLCFLAIFLPAHRACSVDAWWRPAWARRTLPRWARATLMVQFAIVYVYGGIAKLNPDWLVYRTPIRQWLLNASRRVPFGGDILANDIVGLLVPYGGVVYDLFVVPALIWRKTRWYAVAASFVFHLTNAYMFNIGVFPWLMLAVTPIFFEPDWPRKIPRLGPVFGRWVDRGAAFDDPQRRRLIFYAWCAWFVVQILMPLRHHVYPGPVEWNEEGHMYSWRMKLRSKTGKISYRVVDPETQRRWTVDPAEELTSRQVRKLVGRPEFILQYAHHLDEVYRERHGVADPQVYADAFVSLNYRKRQRFVDPDVDLSAERPSFGSYTWVLPFRWTPPRPPK